MLTFFLSKKEHLISFGFTIFYGFLFGYNDLTYRSLENYRINELDNIFIAVLLSWNVKLQNFMETLKMLSHGYIFLCDYKMLIFFFFFFCYTTINKMATLYVKVTCKQFEM